MKSGQHGNTRVAVSLRSTAQRFSVVLLIGASMALMVAARIDERAVNFIRANTVDALSPILDAMAKPASFAARLVEDARGFVYLRQENERLVAENIRLQQWQNLALRLQAENNDLRRLLNFRRDDAEHFVTANVIADTSGSFTRSVLLDRGTEDGVNRGQLAMSGEAIVGRIVEAGRHSARLLLLTDISSRVPVLLQDQRARAILGGDNTDTPKLLFLPSDTEAKEGEWVVTSGYGGGVPSGIPVGVVTGGDNGALSVRPFADFARLEHVRVVDFGVAAGDLEIAERPE